MAKSILILSASLRAGSNSETLANAFADGARAAGHTVEVVSLRGKSIAFCRGCLACQTLGRCVIDDNAVAITEKMQHADVIVFATPIYYYEMSGQLKTLLDRANASSRRTTRSGTFTCSPRRPRTSRTRTSAPSTGSRAGSHATKSAASPGQCSPAA